MTTLAWILLAALIAAVLLCAVLFLGLKRSRSRAARTEQLVTEARRAVRAAAEEESAAQAEQLIAVAADLQGQAGSRAPVSGEVLLQASIPLRASVDGPLRRQPRRGAAVAGSVKKGAPVVARAYKGGWLRVDAEGGRSGWIEHSKLGAR